MFDDFRPHVFKTADFGATWTRPPLDAEGASWVWVVREDPKNTDLLYAGTELGLFASHDAGRPWTKLQSDGRRRSAAGDLQGACRSAENGPYFRRASSPTAR
jgi:photosystem II stability/assembly factor-like uncharacterized protein